MQFICKSCDFLCSFCGNCRLSTIQESQEIVLDVLKGFEVLKMFEEKDLFLFQVSCFRFFFPIFFEFFLFDFFDFFPFFLIFFFFPFLFFKKRVLFPIFRPGPGATARGLPDDPEFHLAVHRPNNFRKKKR